MNDESVLPVFYIETPRTSGRLEKIDVLLEKRMREFLLMRRQKVWRKATD
ncbi:hypothetical protein IPM09_00205 [Candidatus Saccharibacteria bacterium]|nr:MAG: hypothetical protein IPM09_00205 [Candidatus Saccharibacteria bacterium]